MTLVCTPRNDFLRSLAAEIVHHYGRGRITIAIDGADAVGRFAFADDLAAVFRDSQRHTFRASLDCFEYSRADRAGHDSPPHGPEAKAPEDGYDLDALRRVLLDPFRLGGSTPFCARKYDPNPNNCTQPARQSAPADAFLIIDGDSINRPELHGRWLYSVLLEGGADISDARYRTEVHPRDSFTAVVDLSHPEAPQRTLTDRC